MPTMGALHEGHLSLVSAGVKLGLPVTVSIFVNPTQFAPNEDFSRYPRDLENDASLLEKAGTSLLFAPTVAEMYPESGTVVSVASVTELYEGAIRPGHFEGVSTIVCKLFNICQPSISIFGLKDLQQCAVIKRMTHDLNLPIKLLFGETIREENGLAMSSRNNYLSAQNRNLGSEIYKELKSSKTRICNGEPIESVLTSTRSRLTSAGFLVDYFDFIDVNTFRPASTLGEYNAIVGAVRVGTTRLIDNILLFPAANMS